MVMSSKLANDSEPDEMASRMERAVQQALDLRQTVAELFDPQLRELVDVVLIELGRRIATLSR
ncbi:hypothetical protein [Methylobacterium sp. NEAU K]|uniref:hypothetical protein n=1 Tax=Methylobacterium sp. NEAU K TaxID=3064946 RepID=UPI0027369409|nr:hypothetical protein [Methylobacterium sp. NEAU K]MDP4003679.1 hypothetical protein [Methylobacterium sp. NEAU K]